jgi:hypothetical protein
VHLPQPHLHAVEAFQHCYAVYALSRCMCDLISLADNVGRHSYLACRRMHPLCVKIVAAASPEPPYSVVITGSTKGTARSHDAMRHALSPRAVLPPISKS